MSSFSRQIQDKCLNIFVTVHFVFLLSFRILTPGIAVYCHNLHFFKNTGNIGKLKPSPDKVSLKAAHFFFVKFCARCILLLYRSDQKGSLIRAV